jgi:hypothetical protein
VIRLKPLFLAVLAGACLCSSARAHQSAEPTGDPSGPEAVDSHAEASPPAEVKEGPVDPSTESAETQKDDPNSWAFRLRSKLPRISVGGFADVNYAGEWTELDDGTDVSSNRFILGPLDLFLTSQLSERFSFLTEILFEFQNQGENIVDVERLLLKYEYADWLNLSIGRGHTPIGYWNTHFHHGTWLQTTISRPVIFTFEDDGGIVPMHYLGIQVGSQLNFESVSISLRAIVGNGRGSSPAAIQLGDDLNNSKMLGGALEFRPMALPGLSFGASAFADRIPARQTETVSHDALDEVIAGGFVAYIEDAVEFLAEAQVIHHRDRGTDDDYLSWGGYVQGAYRFGRPKAYYRYDWSMPSSTDPFHRTFLDLGDLQLHTLGIRCDLAFFVALKLEYRHRTARAFQLPPATGLGGTLTSNIIIGQVAFAF